MKTSDKATVMFLFPTVFILLCIMTYFTFCTPHHHPVTAKHLYHNGDELLPDYVHTDTLIVSNAALLNQLMDSMPATDAEINNALAATTMTPEKLYDLQFEYHFFVDSAGFTIYNDDKQAIGKLKWGVCPALDSLIMSDNQ